MGHRPIPLPAITWHGAQYRHLVTHTQFLAPESPGGAALGASWWGAGSGCARCLDGAGGAPVRAGAHPGPHARTHARPHPGPHPRRRRTGQKEHPAGAAGTAGTTGTTGTTATAGLEHAVMVVAMVMAGAVPEDQGAGEEQGRGDEGDSRDDDDPRRDPVEGGHLFHRRRWGWRSGSDRRRRSCGFGCFTHPSNIAQPAGTVKSPSRKVAMN